MIIMKRLLLLLASLTLPAKSVDVEADLLIVGGNESACAAAVQAARLGVKKIVLVNDIEWLGGQFSAEGVGCPDEWTSVNGRRVNFPRSGIYSEVIEKPKIEVLETTKRDGGDDEPRKARPERGIQRADLPLLRVLAEAVRWNAGFKLQVPSFKRPGT
jgi:hypothetical protein